MFTGIVEKRVQVLEVTPAAGSLQITLATHWPDVKHGESIAVNGCCLTVARIHPTTNGPIELGFDVVAETLDKTNLGRVQCGNQVHVERAMRIGDRVDGHFVQGHIDGTARLIKCIDDGKEVRLVIEAPMALEQYLVPKGSICVDGVSLTIAALRPGQFEVALIPTTVQLTLLAERPVGWPYNLEADVLSKTIVSWLERRGLDGHGKTQNPPL